MTKTNTYKTNKQTHEKHQIEVITMLKGMTKHEDKGHAKTFKHDALRSLNHKATQNNNNTGTTALERSVA